MLLKILITAAEGYCKILNFPPKPKTTSVISSKPEFVTSKKMLV